MVNLVPVPKMILFAPDVTLCQLPKPILGANYDTNQTVLNSYCLYLHPKTILISGTNISTN